MAGLMDLLSGGGDSSSSADPSQSGGGSGGLMGLYTDPNKAALMGFFQGLMQASGPSRIPVNLGQAFNGGMQGATQGLGNAMQMQRQAMQMRAMQGLMGGGAQQPQQSAQQQPTGDGSGGLFGASAGMGMPGSPNASSAPPAQPQAQPQSATPLIMGRTPQQLWNQGMLMNMSGFQGGSELMSEALKYDPTLAYALPTDAMKNVAAAYGQGTPQAQSALSGIVQKDATTALRPGSPFLMNGKIFSTPGAAPAGYMNNFNNDTGQWSVVPVAGGTDAVRSSSAASAGGNAQYKLQQVWDQNANNGAGGFVQQTVANVADAANGNGAAPAVPVGIRNNNFGNIKGANGQFSTFSTPQDGINAADQILSTYGNKYGINTLTGIANRWAPKGDGNNDPAAKAAAMSAASGIGVNDPINLGDPAVRARILPALFDTETPGWRNAIGGGASGQSAPSPVAGAPAKGPMASAPPLGATNAANAAQTAPSAQMAEAQSHLADSDNSYQASRQALQKMIAITQNGGVGDWATRFLPQDVAKRVNGDAAEYLKAHSNFVSLQGKALGNGGTDASRDTLDNSVPTFDIPADARLSGLNDQLNQLDWNHLKRQTLNPVFQQGDQKTYTAQSASFDNAISPAMMPQIMSLLNMPPGPARGQALQAAAQNPQLKAALDIVSGQFK
ncbi:hypothetical protein [Pararobbsia silviterrae]|uniref:Uncharacterized protein n=1 Tax=Pararobbsia silviterrae TaxID=1792498 RepID=A0A494Y7Q3_9BURK|nr:hypothetical protein [Pararobbsia silviterrae]RKP56356.1 hypothetical protein D7S86_08125 [Pararobbsia silviterrae]